MNLLAVLAFTTMGLMIAFAVWSKLKTDREHDKPTTRVSSLARSTPDPRFRPDPAVTDPFDLNRKK